MMQLLCNGVLLDLPAGQTLSFKKTNILFAFDKVECERSMSFDLPSTPTNERVFDLAKVPAFSGQGMRVRYDAELYDGLLVKRGYLHVERFSKGVYKAVFVTGELVGLQTLRDAGKLSDILNYSDTTPWYEQAGSPAYGWQFLWRCIAYTRKEGAQFPSIRLLPLVEDTLDALGVRYTLPTSSIQQLRIIPSELNGLTEQDTLMTVRTIASMSATSQPDVLAIDISYGNDVLETETAAVLLRSDYGAQINVYQGRVIQYVAMQDLTIVFPDDWDDDCYIGRFRNGGTQFVEEFEFYGERYFDQDHTVYGDSLAGRSVDVASGQAFVIIHSSYFQNQDDSGGTHWFGWFSAAGYGDYRENSFKLSGSVSAVGQIVRVQDNLPDFTAVDLLKIVQGVTGLQLYYDGSAISFDALAFDDWDVIELTDKVISEDNVQRRFGDYAQRNIVALNGEGSVLPSSRVMVEYTIQNENIDAESELQTIPLSEGNADGVYLKASEDVEYLAVADPSYPRLTRPTLRKNSNLQALCDLSTSIDIQARLTLSEWERLTPKTLVQVRGTRYAWMSSTWSKGVASLSLSRV